MSRFYKALHIFFTKFYINQKHKITSHTSVLLRKRDVPLRIYYIIFSYPVFFLGLFEDQMNVMLYLSNLKFLSGFDPIIYHSITEVTLRLKILILNAHSR